MIPQQIQEMKPDVLVRLTNQLNTTLAEVPQFRYASPVNKDEQATARYGTPFFVQALKNAGALPERAREYKERLDK